MHCWLAISSGIFFPGSCMGASDPLTTLLSAVSSKLRPGPTGDNARNAVANRHSKNTHTSVHRNVEFNMSVYTNHNQQTLPLVHLPDYLTYYLGTLLIDYGIRLIRFIHSSHTLYPISCIIIILIWTNIWMDISNISNISILFSHHRCCAVILKLTFGFSASRFICFLFICIYYCKFFHNTIIVCSSIQ